MLRNLFIRIFAEKPKPTIMPENITATAKNAVDSIIEKNVPETISSRIEQLTSTPVEDIMKHLLNEAVSVGLRILLAFVIYFVGRWLIRRIRNFSAGVFEKRRIEPTLATFLLSFINISLTVLLVVTIIGVVGINTSSFAALIAASGVAVGMSLSGTLQNFAGGVMILLFKPFKVGDFIDAQSYSGTVKAIKITTTAIVTPDNRMIIIPNSSLVNGVVNNYSSMGVRRCQWSIGISYGDDARKAIALMEEILSEDPRVLKDPAPAAVLDSLGDSAVVIAARAWVKSEDYWSLYYDVNQTVYDRFPENGLSFPFPQMDVNIKKADQNG